MGILSVRGALVVAGVVAPLAVVLAFRNLRRLQAHATNRVGIVDLLARVAYFKPLRLQGLQAVAAQLFEVRVDADHDVVTMGRRDERGWFFIESGDLEVVIDASVVKDLSTGDTFGELALIRDSPRAATVRTRTEVRLLTLDRLAFLQAVVVGVAHTNGPPTGGVLADDPFETATCNTTPQRVRPLQALAQESLCDGAKRGPGAHQCATAMTAPGELPGELAHWRLGGMIG